MTIIKTTAAVMCVLIAGCDSKKVSVYVGEKCVASGDKNCAQVCVDNTRTYEGEAACLRAALAILQSAPNQCPAPQQTREKP